MKKRKHVKRSELSTLHMVAANENKYTKVDVDDELKEWVGIGWITIPSTKRECEKWPLAVEG